MEKENKCYLCGKLGCTRTIPVVESPKDIGCPPKAWICANCEVGIEEETNQG